jgi:hypothetical protein
MKAILCALAILLTPFWVPANPQETCSFQVESSGNIQVQRMRYGPQKQCMILVSQLSRPDSWRSYSFFESGLFMVFMSFAAGENPANTGAKTFYFFPRGLEPTFRFEAEDLQVIDATGNLHRFELKNGNYQSLEKAVIEVSPNVDPRNEGGFQILSYDGLYLENGFGLGEMPYIDAKRTSKFRKDDNFKQRTFPIHVQVTTRRDQVC